MKVTPFIIKIDGVPRARNTNFIAGTGISFEIDGENVTIVNDGGGGGGGSYTDEQAQDAVGSILVDSSEIDFTYDDAVPSITATLKAGSIDESKLDASVNASLDLADTAVQPGTLSAYFNKSTDDTDDIAVGATNKFATSGEKAKLAFISITQDVDLDAMESSLAGKADASSLGATATSNDYGDLDNLPTIPTEGKIGFNLYRSSGLQVGDGFKTIIEHGGTITEWIIATLSGTSGTITLSVKKSDYASLPTFTSIDGTEKISLSSASKNTDNSLSTWTTTVTAKDHFEITVESVTGTVTGVYGIILITKSL